MESRMANPALSVAGALDILQGLGKVVQEAASAAGVPRSTVELVNLRVSQINGCAVCLDMHSRTLESFGEPAERLHTVAAWRETPYFSDAERAALALAEAGTRIADNSEAVSDEVVREAAKYYDEQALGALVLAIAAINTWNRLNVISGQVTGDWVKQWGA